MDEKNKETANSEEVTNSEEITNPDEVTKSEEIINPDEVTKSEETTNSEDTLDMEIVDYEKNKVEAYDFTDENVVKADNEVDDEKPLAKIILLEVWSYVKLFIIAILLALFINNFIIINATVPTGSMENTIMTESRIIGLRLSYLFHGPERGDIVVFKYPLDESTNYVKRVIGLPGERVEISNGEVYIYNSDNQLIEGPLKEDYLKEEWDENNDGFTFEIPEDSYLMMGDNRNSSADVRSWKEYVEQDPEKYGNNMDIIYVKSDKILGKVFFCYWNKGIHLDWLDGQDVNYDE